MLHSFSTRLLKKKVTNAAAVNDLFVIGVLSWLILRNIFHIKIVGKKTVMLLTFFLGNFGS